MATKSCQQQSCLTLHRTRQWFVRRQTSVINAIRAHLAEFGIVAPVGRNGVAPGRGHHRGAVGELHLDQGLLDRALAPSITLDDRLLEGLLAKLWYLQPYLAGLGLQFALAVAGACIPPGFAALVALRIAHEYLALAIIGISPWPGQPIIIPDRKTIVTVTVERLLNLGI